jgi:hypothetical protein
MDQLLCDDVIRAIAANVERTTEMRSLRQSCSTFRAAVVASTKEVRVGTSEHACWELVSRMESLESLRVVEHSFVDPSLGPVRVGLKHFDELESLPEMKSIKNIELTDCYATDLAPLLKKCPNVESLRLFGCMQLVDLSPLGSCAKLMNVSITGCPKVKDLSALGSCSSLQRLELEGCSEKLGLKQLAVLAGAKQLKRLKFTCIMYFIHTWMSYIKPHELHCSVRCDRVEQPRSFAAAVAKSLGWPKLAGERA